MNVVMISRVRMNPYVNLLAKALQDVEPGLTCSIEESLTPNVVARWHGRAQVFHLHWPELYYRSTSPLRASRKLASYIAALLQARWAGIGLVYTAHNVQQHEGVSLLDAIAEAWQRRLICAVHVHDEAAKSELLSHWRPRRIAVIAHGNYIGAYPDTCTRAEARQQLGINGDHFVFLALGQIRPYKGMDALIQAFRGLASDKLRLIIAGHPHDARYGTALMHLANGDKRIRLDLRFIPDDEVQYYLRAADFCVLPYHSVTTSGAAILAFSFARPVIAPDSGPFPALVTGGSGLLYTSQEDGLAHALAAATQMNTEQAGQAALAIARSLDWQSVARQHLAVYRSLI